MSPINKILGCFVKLSFEYYFLNNQSFVEWEVIWHDRNVLLVSVVEITLYHLCVIHTYLGLLIFYLITP